MIMQDYIILLTENHECLQENDGKLTPPVAASGTSKPIRFAYVVQFEKGDYCGDFKTTKNIGVSLSLAAACKLGGSKIPNARSLGVRKNPTLKEGAIVADGVGMKGHKGTRFEAWVQRWSITDWDAVNEGKVKKPKKARKSESAGNDE